VTRALALVAVVACGGARPTPAPQRAVATAAAPADAAVDAAGECVEPLDVRDGPPIHGGTTALEICTTSATERVDRGMFYERHAALVYHSPDGASVRVELGEWREEHDEYYQAIGWSIAGAIGDAVLLDHAFGTDTIVAYVLDGDSWASVGELATGDRVDVELVDATRARLTPCTLVRDEHMGWPTGECTPSPSVDATWTGSTVIVK
jgi:hypothetical protein